MNEKELLAKTQMALANTFPWQDEYGQACCIHCGYRTNYEHLRKKSPREIHYDTCIWLIALLAIGDYEDK